jgi:hypothetical protein
MAVLLVHGYADEAYDVVHEVPSNVPTSTKLVFICIHRVAEGKYDK